MVYILNQNGIISITLICVKPNDMHLMDHHKLRSHYFKIKIR